jgi:hypothetical protein
MSLVHLDTQFGVLFLKNNLDTVAAEDSIHSDLLVAPRGSCTTKYTRPGYTKNM